MLGWTRPFFPFFATFRSKETGVSLHHSCSENTRISSRHLRGASAEGAHVDGGPLGVRPWGVATFHLKTSERDQHRLFLSQYPQNGGGNRHDDRAGRI